MGERQVGLADGAFPRRSPFARPSFNTSSTIRTHALSANDFYAGEVRPMRVTTSAAVIAHSQIVLAQPHSPMPALPAGFEDLDIAVLDWIAVEGRRLGRGSCGYGPGG
jgi:hypothetical protein